MKLALALIGKDEEDNIKRLLESVKDGVEGVAYVDTGSTDNTKQVVIEHCFDNDIECFVQDFEWESDFSKARNKSFELAKKIDYDWLLWLDCDDVVEDIVGLRYGLQQLSPETDCVLLPYYYAWDSYGHPSVVHTRERLFRQGTNPIWENRKIHECINLTGYNVVKLNYPIFHRRTQRDIEIDSNRNVNLLKLEYNNKPDDPRTIFYYARELYHSGAYDRALELFKIRVSEKCLHGSYDERFASYMYMAEYYISVKQFAEALENLNKALLLHDDVPDCYFLRGICYEGLGKNKAAIHSYESAIRSDCHYRETTYEGQKGGLIGGFGVKLLSNIYRGVQGINTRYQLGIYLPRSYIEPLKKLEFLYHNIGLYKEALEICNLISEYSGRDAIIHDIHYLKDMAKRRIPHSVILEHIVKNGGLKLNIGSGSQKISGFFNIDKYDDRADIQSSLLDLELPSRCCKRINAFHFLEHLDVLEYMKTMYEISRIMIPKGIFEITVPDFEECSKELIKLYELEKQQKDDSPKNLLMINWYFKTIYGRQVTEGNIDLGQFHKKGFLQKFLEMEIQNLGFSIIKSEKYVDNDTPSLRLIAQKKLVVIFPQLEETFSNPSSRLRHALVYAQIKQWHKNNIHAVCSKGNLQQEINQCLPDVVIISQYGGEFNAIIERHKGEIKFIYDYSEDMGAFSSCYDTMKRCHVIVCCSSALADKVKNDLNVENQEVVVIPDMYEDRNTDELIKKLQIHQL